MIKILICCLGGFSSSAMVKKVKNEIIQNNLQDKMLVEFVKKHDDLDIPLYILPPKMYGNMNAKELYIDAEDIIKGYNESKMNPWHFPGEEEVMTVKRACSHRNYKG